jgi:environmental stress-induced protein Ves
VSPTSTTTYTVTGTGLNGCQATEMVTVNVNALPVVTAMPDASICANGTIALTVSGADSYVWNNGAGSGASVNVSPTTTTTYTVTGTSLAGCSNADQVIITVNALPTVVATADVMICEQETTQLGATGANTYVWDNGAGSGANVNVSPTSSLLYTVTGTDVNGCSAQDMVMVTVNPLPVVSINGDASVCLGDQANLTASGASTYLWSNGLGTTASVFAAPTTTTTYTVEGTNGSGCSATEQFTVSVNAVDVSVGIDQYTLTALSTTATAYQWIDCNNNNIALTGETNNTYTAASNGNYAVIVTENGCQDTSACYMIGGIGIDENALDQIVVYPNPTKGLVYITNVDQDVEFEIISYDGKRVAIGEFKQGDNQIDLSNYANGMYFLKIGERTIKLDKQ